MMSFLIFLRLCLEEANYENAAYNNPDPKDLRYAEFLFEQKVGH